MSVCVCVCVCVCVVAGSTEPPHIGCGKGGNVTAAGWQVTLCDPIRHAREFPVAVRQVSCELSYIRILRYTARIRGIPENPVAAAACVV